MSACEECPGIAAGAVARTMTTVIVALASVVVMALGGCASQGDIESAPRIISQSTSRAA